MKVKINTHGNALPEVHGEWIDLCTAEDVTLDFLEYKIISLGVSIEIPAGYYAHVVPRSSTFGKWGILLANSMGVIENDYCGDGDVWGYPALCLRKEGTRIPKGTRICQFRLVEKAPDMEFVQVESLGNRDRGGFGSTGEQVHTGGTAERNKPERNSRVERMFGERESWATAELGVEPVLINSALVSAQNRQRIYWVGKREPDGTYSQVPVEQPEDRGILLRDILETGICWREKGYALTASSHSATAEDMFARRQRNGVAEPIRIGTIENDAKKQDFDSQQYRVYSPDGKSVTLCGNGGGVGAKTGLYAVPISAENDKVILKAIDILADRKGYVPEMFNPYNRTEITGKAPTLSTGSMVTSSCAVLIFETADGKQIPVYEVRGGRITIKGKEYPIKLRDGLYIIRKLTVTECKRLQTVPDTYAFPVSDTQAYKMLGNGWTVDVIAHIMNHFTGLTEEPVEVLSMYDGMSCGHIALDKLGVDITVYYATEIDKYAIQTTQHNYPETVQLGDAFQVRDDEWRPRRAAEVE